MCMIVFITRAKRGRVVESEVEKNEFLSICIPPFAFLQEEDAASGLREQSKRSRAKFNHRRALI